MLVGPDNLVIHKLIEIFEVFVAFVAVVMFVRVLLVAFHSLFGVENLETVLERAFDTRSGRSFFVHDRGLNLSKLVLVISCPLRMLRASVLTVVAIWSVVECVGCRIRS